MMCLITLMYNDTTYGYIEYNSLETNYTELSETLDDIIRDFNEGFDNWYIEDVINELQEEFNITFYSVDEVDTLKVEKKY